MALAVTGKFLGEKIEKREWQGDSWVEQTWYVLDGVEVHNVRLARDFSSEKPQDGDLVALEVECNAWQSKRGNVGMQITGKRRVLPLEKALTGAKVPA